ncbi:hypothetical protein ACFXG4_43380 [Nocardia sp. NPDC059246]
MAYHLAYHRTPVYVSPGDHFSILSGAGLAALCDVLDRQSE